MVATLPSSEVNTSDGSIFICPKGTMVVVGEPSLIVLIWTVTGTLVSFVLKNKSPPVTNTPSASWDSTKKDWASGSYHPPTFVSVPVVSLVVISWVILVTGWSVPICFLSTWGVLIERTCSSTDWVYPLAVYVASAELSPGSSIAELTLLVVILMVFNPVVNFGLDATVGSGMCSVNIKSPFSSLTNLKSSTVASAVPVKLTRTIPFLTYPKWSGLVCDANPAVSTFKIVELAVYWLATPDWVSWGLLNGPILWFDFAKRIFITGSFGPADESTTVSTISPTEKDPLFIEIPKNFGVQKDVISTFSMKT